MRLNIEERRKFTNQNQKTRKIINTWVGTILTHLYLDGKLVFGKHNGYVSKSDKFYIMNTENNIRKKRSKEQLEVIQLTAINT